DDHLRPAAGKEIERGEALKHAYRIDRTQNRDGTREADALRSRRRRRENHRRGGVEVLATVVFADSEYVQPRLLGMLDLLDQVQQTVRRADPEAALGVRRGKAIDTHLHVTPRLRELPSR